MESRIYFANDLFDSFLITITNSPSFKRAFQIIEASRMVHTIYGLDYKNNRMQMCSYAYACNNREEKKARKKQMRPRFRRIDMTLPVQISRFQSDIRVQN